MFQYTHKPKLNDLIVSLRMVIIEEKCIECSILFIMYNLFRLSEINYIQKLISLKSLINKINMKIKLVKTYKSSGQVHVSSVNSMVY